MVVAIVVGPSTGILLTLLQLLQLEFHECTVDIEQDIGQNHKPHHY